MNAETVDNTYAEQCATVAVDLAAFAVVMSHLSLLTRFKHWLKEPLRQRAPLDDKRVISSVARVAAEEILYLRARIVDLEAELAKLKGK